MSSSVNSPYWLASTAATVHAMRLKVRSGRCLLWVVKISRGERRRDPRMPPICCAAAHLSVVQVRFDDSATRRQSQRFPACPLAGASIENFYHAPLDACARRQFPLAEFLMWHGSSPQTRGASSANQMLTGGWRTSCTMRGYAVFRGLPWRCWWRSRRHWSGRGCAGTGDAGVVRELSADLG